MKIQAKRANSLPRNWKVTGLSSKDWKDLNSGKAIEVESIPDDYKGLVDEVESKSPSASVTYKTPSKGGK